MNFLEGGIERTHKTQLYTENHFHSKPVAVGCGVLENYVLLRFSELTFHLFFKSSPTRT